eukprot:CAMPEP_0113321870 /NCGR_PEP_ID=MMETSP0010_2-20120614/15207_1 /TAXON_ID=216773 ORGANISM="Corethron hystrix, Strain 308" /NCGR_SAMPLE_ID=MMETSP0010_2 /ASSEMBLY_ACC=CAM_ASM_000155 /LENGTH=87 /DNA_ID=CAMNT_0000180141 /DNA_START=659 /DNA_END=919 /DNA_ORIENTATION=+ /assembly_acc=CAM_ASM_000155
MPYTHEDEEMLPVQLRNLRKAGGEFLVHVGDIIDQKKKRKDKSLVCPEERYEMVSNILRKAPIKTFILPGDNDWNDCPYPDEAMTYW